MADKEKPIFYRGGVLPLSEDELKRAEKADLIVLPSDVKGTNCGNCRFVRKTKDTDILYCSHKRVQQEVTDRMCCALWDAEGSFRPWQDKLEMGDVHL